MRKIITMLVAFALIGLSARGQMQTNHWFFGGGAGLVFNGGHPVADTTGALGAEEGCAAISDSIGHLLFYTNGVTVWNKNNQIMSNGDSLWGDLLSLSSTQAAIIIPQPSSNTIYYIFTVSGQAGIWGGFGGIAYSVVDMSLQGGLGAVTIKNDSLLSKSTEQICAVKHANGTDIWVMGQQWGTNSKYAWSVTSSGINTTPVISNIGTSHNDSINDDGGAQGTMKFSSDGSKLASSISQDGIIDIFDFDNSSGVVSNVITLDSSLDAYGVEFSPDGKKLYSSGWNSQLYQWDLTTWNHQTINNSQTLIHQTPFSPTMHIMLQLQLGMDCRIYVAKEESDTLGVIEDPNQPGLLCNYNDTALSLAGRQSQSGLPSFISSYFNVCNSEGINSVKVLSFLSLYPNPTTSLLTLSLPNTNQKATINLYDMLGEKVLPSYSTSSTQSTIDLSHLPQGIYFLEVLMDGEKQVRKVVKIN